jgi:hypothetical protein
VSRRLRSNAWVVAVVVAACADPVEGRWQGKCVGDDEPATWELTLESDGSGELESVDSNGHRGDADVEWESSGSSYDLELDWGGHDNDWECDLDGDAEELECKLVKSSHDATCELDRND